MDTDAKRTELAAARIVVARQVAGIEIGVRIARALSLEALGRRLDALLDKRKRRLGLILDELSVLDRLDEADGRLLLDGFPSLPNETIPAADYAAILEEQAQFNAFVAIFQVEAEATLAASMIVASELDDTPIPTTT